MTKLTIRDCFRAVQKRYGVVMEDTQSYPTTYVWSNAKCSLKLYKTYVGQIRLFVMPLDDIMADKFYDINDLEDIYTALDPWKEAIGIRQVSLFEAM